MKAIIFGGGKIARGFIAQLLYQSKYEIVFVEQNQALVDQLNRAGKYYVNVMGHENESQWIDGYSCLTLDDVDGIAETLKTADIGFTAVGGKNLNELGNVISVAYKKIAKDMDGQICNIICCENWKNPAEQLETAIIENLQDEELQESFSKHIGISEAAILRSGVEATKEVKLVDSNAVSVTSYWELPVNKERIKGTPKTFTGVRYQENFGSFLQRKIYTFNTTNATIAYLGSLKGIIELRDAANDPEILQIVEQMHDEVNPAIAAEMGVGLMEQDEFSKRALAKYQDRSVVDFTERHARDPLRKLGATDRIVGTIRLAQKHGIVSEGLSYALAAAIYYSTENSEDPSAEILKKMRREGGPEKVLQDICNIKPTEEIAYTVREKIKCLRERGWIDE